jgi:hypothetical protein
MTKNSFKKIIQERYKGRGNSWVKVMKSQEGSAQIQKLLDTLPKDKSAMYIQNTDREGFYWIRFVKAEGSSNESLVRFEVRYKGSKIDHPEFTVVIKDEVAQDFALLGNTPYKLQFEIDPANRKAKKSEHPRNFVAKQIKSDDVFDVDVDVEKEIRIIKEVSLTKPTNRELEEWYEFLKVNNIYEENV